MALETGTYISDLVNTNPTSTDAKSDGDDHIRLLKSTILTTFPSITGAVTATHTELNTMDGITANTAELNIMDGVTSTTAELNILDGVLASTAEINHLQGVTGAIQTQIDAKAPTASPTFTGTVVLPATTSIGTVDSTEIGYLNGVTSAIQTQIDTINTNKANLAGPTFTGTVTLPATTSIGTVDSTELGYLNGVTSAIQTQLNTLSTSKADLASPALTGNPTAPTQLSTDDSTKIATTAFVQDVAFNSALPDQTGNNGKFVTTNGTTASWQELKTVDGQSLAGSGDISVDNGWVFISEVTASTATTVTFDSLDTYGYHNFIVVLDNLVGSANNMVLIELQTGGSTWATDYYSSKGTLDTTMQGFASTSETAITTRVNTETAITDQYDNAWMVVHLFTETSGRVLWDGHSSSRNKSTGAGGNKTSGACTGVRFSKQTGTFDGVLRLYGIKDS